MAKMTLDEREQFLADLHVGVIAVERPDRVPLTVPIWYGYQPGGDVVLWTGSDSVKYKLIRKAGRFAITVQDEKPPYRYVTAEGDVTGIAPAEPAEVRALAVRYLGDEAGESFAGDNFTPTSIIIRMRPQRWLTMNGAE